LRLEVALPMSWVMEAKMRAAEAAAAHVKSGYVVGLGSGSTTAHLIRIIGSRLRLGELSEILGVPTSNQTMAEAVEAGIPLTSLDEHPQLELAVDGADQINDKLEAIKGGGGALLREKVVASASNKYILIADERKLTSQLGKDCLLPIEILPFARRRALDCIRGLGAHAVIRMRHDKTGPFVTDNGNFIIDADFGVLDDPYRLDGELKAIPGVIETGLFLDLADIAYIGTQHSLKEIRR
jgi:ribose 5-phosphate isomerase A